MTPEYMRLSPAMNANVRPIHTAIHPYTPASACQAVENLVSSPHMQRVCTMSEEHSPSQAGADANDTTSQCAESTKTDDGSSSTIPAWTELKTKAGKERKRLPLACIACRRKKIRCSGEKPACRHCLRSRIPCVYKVTARKAAPRTDYMAMLDKRLRRMEDRVIKTIPKEEQGIVNTTGRAVVKPALPPPPPSKPTSSKKRGATEAFVDELEEWAEGAATLPFPKDVTGKSTNGDGKKGDEQTFLQEGADKLPSMELQEHLAEVYFDYAYGQGYHLLHKPSFMRKLAAGEVPPVLMLAVCAISARFSNHPHVRTEPAFLRGDSWATAAREISLRRFDTPNLTILIVYLILGLHEFGTCQGGRSWMFGGMAQRMAYALQLHRDAEYDAKDPSRDKSALTFIDREIRRRTMWSCFLMDRFSSSGTDRPMFVREEYINAQLPIKESYYRMEIDGNTENLDGYRSSSVEHGPGQVGNPRDNMGVAAYLIRLVAIWGRLIAYLNLGGKERDLHPMWEAESKFQSIRRATEAWRTNLPESLHYSPENLQNHASEKIANQFLFLHIVYNQILLFMNRFALPTNGRVPNLPKDMPEEFIAEAARTACEAANQISLLVHEAMDHLVVAPFAGYCAFFSSTVHIQGAFSKNAQLEASSKQNLAWNVKYLTKIKKYWGMFHFITENLRDLYRRHADAARSGTQAGREGDTSIFQYGDWFDRYPHGVSGTDYEEPSAEIKKEPGSDAVLGQKSDLQTVEEFFSKLSPPGKAAHLHGQHQTAKHSNSKKRKSSTHASEGKTTSSAPTSHARHSISAGSQVSQPPSISQVTHDLAANIDAGFAQNTIAFPPGFQAPQNTLAMTQPLHYMSHLDRQMVINSYGNDAILNPSMPDASPNVSVDNFDFNPFANTAQQPENTNGFWGDPSTAWFMPFNMEPPTVGEDNNLFSGAFDYSFGAWGDMASIGPTGLTPQPMHNGQDGLESESGMDMHV